MAKTERFLVIEQDQEIVRFNERLRQLRALSPEQRIKSNTLLPEFMNCAPAENGDYTCMPQQEHEWG